MTPADAENEVLHTLKLRRLFRTLPLFVQSALFGLLLSASIISAVAFLAVLSGGPPFPLALAWPLVFFITAPFLFVLATHGFRLFSLDIYLPAIEADYPFLKHSPTLLLENNTPHSVREWAAWVWAEHSVKLRYLEKTRRWNRAPASPSLKTAARIGAAGLLLTAGLGLLAAPTAYLAAFTGTSSFQFLSQFEKQAGGPRKNSEQTPSIRKTREKATPPAGAEWRLEFTVHPPEYFHTEDYLADSDTLVVPEGSRIEVRILPRRDSSGGSSEQGSGRRLPVVVFRPPGTSVPLLVSSEKGTDWLPSSSGRWEAQAVSGRKVSGWVQVKLDYPPALEISAPEHFRPDGNRPLEVMVTASDDYGISELAVMVEAVGSRPEWERNFHIPEAVGGTLYTGVFRISADTLDTLPLDSESLKLRLQARDRPARLPVFSQQREVKLLRRRGGRRSPLARKNHRLTPKAPAKKGSSSNASSDIAGTHPDTREPPTDTLKRLVKTDETAGGAGNQGNRPPRDRNMEDSGKRQSENDYEKPQATKTPQETKKTPTGEASSSGHSTENGSPRKTGNKTAKADEKKGKSGEKGDKSRERTSPNPFGGPKGENSPMNRGAVAPTPGENGRGTTGSLNGSRSNAGRTGNRPGAKPESVHMPEKGGGSGEPAAAGVREELVKAMDRPGGESIGETPVFNTSFGEPSGKPDRRKGKEGTVSSVSTAVETPGDITSGAGITTGVKSARYDENGRRRMVSLILNELRIDFRHRRAVQRFLLGK